MRIHATEHETQNAILELLAAEGIFAFRLNTGAMAGENKGKKWFMRFHSLGKGAGDILAFVVLPIRRLEIHVNGGPFPPKGPEFFGGIKPLWLEVKREKKATQSPEQVSFQKHVESVGHRYAVVRSVDEVVYLLRQMRGA